MKVGLGAIHEPDYETLQFVRQLGVGHIIVHSPELRGPGYWEFTELVQMRTRIESMGIQLYAIENVPRHFYDKILEGKPGRDEQIENMRKTITHMGRAGIRVFGYHFILLGVWRTEYSPRGRGGSLVTRYDHAQVENAPIADIGEYDDDMVWANFEYFLKALIPVAEQEGVTMALHPDDPPVPKIAGVARIIRSIDAYKRVMEMAPSPNNCIEFCQGTIAEMCSSADEVYDAIRYFGSRNKISYVHFRNVTGCVPDFSETYIEEGYVDMLKAMRCYKEVNFPGVLIGDHVPGIVSDTRWGHRGRAYTTGYIKALIKCVEEGC